MILGRERTEPIGAPNLAGFRISACTLADVFYIHSMNLVPIVTVDFGMGLDCLCQSSDTLGDIWQCTGDWAFRKRWFSHVSYFMEC